MTKFVDSLGLKRLVTKIAEAVSNGTWLPIKKGEGEGSVAEGGNTVASGAYSHAQGSYNYDDPSFMDVVGVGNDNTTKNASVIYVKRDTEGYPNPSDPKRYCRGHEECARSDSRP